MIDVLIAGSGPAGLAAAVNAAQCGLETVVMDPRQAPIDKACGEGLMPAALRGLAELGVHPSGQPILGIRYRRGERTAQARFASGVGAGVRRTDLQELLRARASDAGVRFVTASVQRITQNDRSVTAAGLTARYLIAADGLHSPIRRGLGLDVAPRPGQVKRWGLRQHFAIEPWSEFVEVHWGTRAEVYVTPVAPDVVGVAVLTDQRCSFAEVIAAFPAVASRLPAAGVSTVRGAGPLRQQSSRRVAGRVLLVGDAAGYVDAITGDGIAVAQASAAALIRCLAAERPEDYEREWRRACRRYRLITESLLWARSRRRLEPLIVPAAQRAPWLFAVAVNQLAR